MYNCFVQVVNYVSAFSDEEAEEEKKEEKVEENEDKIEEKVVENEVKEDEQPGPDSGSSPNAEPEDPLAKGDSPEIVGVDRDGLDAAVGLPMEDVRNVPRSFGGSNQLTTEYYFYQGKLKRLSNN